MHLTTDQPLEKCRICSGIIIKRPSTGEIYCTGCFRNYSFLQPREAKSQTEPTDLLS